MANTAQTTAAKVAPADAARARARGATLKELETQVSEDVAGVRQRVKARAEHAQTMTSLGEEIAEAVANRNIDKAKLLMSNFHTAATSRDELEKTQRGSMLRLAAAMKGATGALQQLTTFTAPELKRITDAEQAVKDAEGIVTRMQAEKTEAYGRTKFAGIRNRAIAAAQTALEAAEADVITLKAAVETQRAIASSEKDARVQNIPLDESATQILTATNEAVTLARDNLVETRDMLGEIQQNRVRTQAALETFAKQRSTAEANLVSKRAAISTAEHELEDMASLKGTQTYVERENALEQLRADRLVLEGEQATALEMFRTSQAAFKEFTTQETALQVHIQSIELEIAILEANVRDQTATIASFGVIAKRADDLRALHVADDEGREMREGVAKTTVEFTTAALAARADRAEAMPAHLKVMDDIIEVGTQAQADSDARMQAQMDLLTANYQKTLAGTPAS